MAFQFQFGPFKFNGNLTLGVGYEYTDNANSSETDPESESLWSLDFGPTGTGALSLPLRSGGTALTIATSGTASYQYSLEERAWEFDFSSPVSAVVSLPLYIRGWTVTATDTFSFNNSPLESTVVVEDAEDAMQYSNSASITAARQFGRLGVTFGISRTDKWAPDEPDTEEAVHQINFTPSLAISEYHSLFWSHTVGITLPDDPGRSKATGYSTTVGVSGRLTQTLNGTIGIGYTTTRLGAINSPTTNSPAQVIDGINAVAALSYAHPLRPNTSHSFSFAYSPGVTALLNDSNVQESYSATYALTHRLNRRAVISPTINWNFIRDLGNSGSGEATHLIRAGFAASSPLMNNLDATMGYFYQTRDSNLPAETYDAHELNVSLSWRLPRRITPQVTYTFEKRDATTLGESYQVNTVNVTVNYTF